jgi:hypothetical protein
MCYDSIISAIRRIFKIGEVRIKFGTAAPVKYMDPELNLVVDGIAYGRATIITDEPQEEVQEKTAPYGLAGIRRFFDEYSGNLKFTQLVPEKMDACAKILEEELKKTGYTVQDVVIDGITMTAESQNKYIEASRNLMMKENKIVTVEELQKHSITDDSPISPTPAIVPAQSGIRHSRPKFCPECGTPTGTSGNFCTNCGYKLV